MKTYKWEDIVAFEEDDRCDLVKVNDVIKKLEGILNKHRKEAFITCEETCLCWEIDNLINKLKGDDKE